MRIECDVDELQEMAKLMAVDEIHLFEEARVYL